MKSINFINPKLYQSLLITNQKLIKHLWTTIILFNSALNAHGQIVCGMNWPKENLRPDTVSTFLFKDKSLSVKGFQNAKPTSNFSFSTKYFDMTWMPIYTSDIKKFIDRSFKSYPKHQIIDTLNCKIFGQNHNTIVVKLKRKIQLVTFLNQNGQQDIFITTIKDRKKIKQTIEYLETTLL
jgi:hypothetical protein